MKQQIEWAVVQPVFRGIDVVKGGLRSEEEANLWIAALAVTQKREDTEYFRRTDGMIAREPMRVAWRVVDPWHFDVRPSE
ncbi:MAG TPA: hypothetical protein VLA89_04360 [Gemmatimonadales bacterium]|nr:hypothetical protein [Gemmatimonadales bacterium]